MRRRKFEQSNFAQDVNLKNLIMKKIILTSFVLITISNLLFANGNPIKVTCMIEQQNGIATIIPNKDYLTEDYWNAILYEDGQKLSFKSTTEAINRMSPFGWRVVKTWVEGKKTCVLMEKDASSMDLKSSRERMMKYMEEAEKKYSGE